MIIIEVPIHDEGEHWHKTVKLFGLTVYHRHDYTKNVEKKKAVGFNVYPTNLVEVEDEDCWPEEDKHRI